LTHDSPTRFVVGAISVRKGLAAKELANTLGPPTFNGVALRQKIGNGFVASDEDESLTDERCFENIAELGKASGREIRVPKKLMASTMPVTAPVLGRGRDINRWLWADMGGNEA
jgi:hypothetical protein